MPGSSDIGGLNLPGLFALLFVVGVVLAPVFFGRGDDPGNDEGGGGGRGPKSPPEPPNPPSTGIDPKRRHGRRRAAPPRAIRRPASARHPVAPPSPRRTPHPPSRRPGRRHPTPSD